jgi:hypothetical protein
MLDDSDLDLLSGYLMAASAISGLLAVFLYRRNPRWRDVDLLCWRAKSDIQWTGKGFEPGTVAERIAQVRRDYAHALHCRPHGRLHSRALLGAASQVVRACAYWRNATGSKTDQESHAPDSKGPAGRLLRFFSS